MRYREVHRRWRAVRAVWRLSTNDVRHLRYLATVTMSGGHSNVHCVHCQRLKQAAERMGALDVGQAASPVEGR